MVWKFWYLWVIIGKCVLYIGFLDVIDGLNDKLLMKLGFVVKIILYIFLIIKECVK